MKETPRECREKWEGRQLQITCGEEGCCLVLKAEGVSSSGAYKHNPVDIPILTMRDQREILVALVSKAGGTLTV